MHDWVESKVDTAVLVHSMAHCLISASMSAAVGAAGAAGAVGAVWAVAGGISSPLTLGTVEKVTTRKVMTSTNRRRTVFSSASLCHLIGNERIVMPGKSDLIWSGPRSDQTTDQAQSEPADQRSDQRKADKKIRPVKRLACADF